MRSMQDIFFPRGHVRDYKPEKMLVAMGLNALVYLDSDEYAGQLQSQLDLDSVVRVPGQIQFGPSMLFLKKGGTCVVSFEGTRGMQAWWNYVQGAGALPYGNTGGRVFAPFAALVNSCLPVLSAELPSGNAIIFTGHSLGAAVAAMAACALRQGRSNDGAVYLFACPKFGDFAYMSGYRNFTWLVNNPIDPVPLLPPDFISLRSETPGLSWGGPFLFPTAARWPGASPLRLGPLTGINWYQSLVASNVNPATGPHQTYWYIRELFNACDPNTQQANAGYVSLLRDQGLFDPWNI